MGKPEFDLPDAKNEFARKIVEHIDKVSLVLSSSTGVDRKVFLTTVIVAANELKPNSCSPESVLISAFNCARIGLCPGGILGHAYFIPYKKKCQLIIGYRGFIELGFRNGFLVSCHTEVVLRSELLNKQFEYWVDKDGPHFRHNFNPFERQAPSRDNVAGSYCVWQSKDGGQGVRAVSIGDIMKIVRSDSDFWNNYFVQGCHKTSVRRSVSMWRTSPELATANWLEDRVDRDEPQELGDSGVPQELLRLSSDPHEETIDLEAYKGSAEDERAT